MNEQAIARAQRAKQILEDDLVKGALSSIRQGLQEQLWSSACRGEINDKLNAMAWACDQFERCFAVMIQDGDVAKQELLMEANAKVRLADINERMRRYAHG